jgi:hypothetical protein
MTPPPRNNASLVLSAVMYGVGYWLTELAANSISFAVQVHFNGWNNKRFRDFELGIFIITLAIFCAALIVLLGQAFGRPFAGLDDLGRLEDCVG